MKFNVLQSCFILAVVLCLGISLSCLAGCQFTPDQQAQLKAALAYEGSKFIIENTKFKPGDKAKVNKCTLEIQEIIAYGKTPQVKHIVLFLGKYNAVLTAPDYKELLVALTNIISKHINLKSLTRPLTQTEMLFLINILKGIEEGSR